MNFLSYAEEVLGKEINCSWYIPVIRDTYSVVYRFHSDLSPEECLKTSLDIVQVSNYTAWPYFSFSADSCRGNGFLAPGPIDTDIRVRFISG